MKLKLGRARKSRALTAHGICFRYLRMPTRALRQNEQAQDDEARDDRGGEWAAERKTAVAHRLVEIVADSRAERPRENEGGPEEQDP